MDKCYICLLPPGLENPRFKNVIKDDFEWNTQVLPTKLNHVHRHIIQNMCVIDIESFNDYINFIRAYFKIPDSAVKALSFRSGVHCEIKNLLKMEGFFLTNCNKCIVHK